MADNPTCATCRWWDAWHNAAITGNCHRYAPRPGDEVDMGNWPAVSAGKWCGEHAPRVAESARQESPDASV
jgi:hypothetical protein